MKEKKLYYNENERYIISELITIANKHKNATEMLN